MGRPPLLGALDLDGDRRIDKEEISKAVQALEKLDVNGDGALDLDELMQMPAPGARGKALDRPGKGRGRQGRGPAGRTPRKAPTG